MVDKLWFNTCNWHSRIAKSMPSSAAMVTSYALKHRSNCSRDRPGTIRHDDRTSEVLYIILNEEKKNVNRAKNQYRKMCWCLYFLFPSANMICLIKTKAINFPATTTFIVSQVIDNKMHFNVCNAIYTSNKNTRNATLQLFSRIIHLSDQNNYQIKFTYQTIFFFQLSRINSAFQVRLCVCVAAF